ncbi:MAG: hypothetical protein K5663_03880 [Clostridiales bacterium]|nr:hypothetical protein [Clostridiales bacterium]
MDTKRKSCRLLIRNGTGKNMKRNIFGKEMGRILFNAGDSDWYHVHVILPEPVWEKLYEKDWLVYEGFTVDHKAFGAGRAFNRDGSVYMEGMFGIKGLLFGKVYYPNGFIRFEGCFRLNRAYGPNYPEYGSWFDEQGSLKYHGRFRIYRSSLGYPYVRIPEGFGKIPSAEMKEHLFMWNDARKYMNNSEKRS